MDPAYKVSHISFAENVHVTIDAVRQLAIESFFWNTQKDFKSCMVGLFFNQNPEWYIRVGLLGTVVVQLLGSWTSQATSLD